MVNFDLILARISTFLATLLFAVAALFGLVGCNSLQPNAFPKELSIAAEQVSTAMTSESVWKDILASVDGQVVNPGIRTGAGVEYFAYARLEGVSGQVSIHGKGEGTGKQSEAREALLLKLADRPDLIELLLRAWEKDRSKLGPVVTEAQVPSNPTSAPAVPVEVPVVTQDNVGALILKIEAQKRDNSFKSAAEENAADELLDILRQYRQVQ